MPRDYDGGNTTGFVNPAGDSLEGPIDLSEILDLRRPHRYPVRVKGDALAECGIQHGDILIADAAATPALAVCVAGPWKLGRAAQRAQNREACEVVRSLTQNLADRMHAMAASSRELEQESRRTAATWRAMDAAIPEHHSSGDDIFLRVSADLAAINERLADQEERFASETDLRAADLDARIASRCDEGGL